MDVWPCRILNFWPPELWGTKFLLLLAIKAVVICYSSHRELISVLIRAMRSLTVEDFALTCIRWNHGCYSSSSWKNPGKRKFRASWITGVLQQLDIFQTLFHRSHHSTFWPYLIAFVHMRTNITVQFLSSGAASEVTPSFTPEPHQPTI
jgi:hypothetical protein